MRAAVVGGGVSGTAAAWALRRGGADVTLVFDRAGASALYSGALDLESWESDRPDAAVSPDAIAFATAFDAWALGTRGCRIATYEGVLRAARGVDAALLDLVPLVGRTISVADAPVDGWDGARMARALTASRWAARTRTRFQPVRVAGLVDADEARGSSYDVAALHDGDGRVARLAECLERAEKGADAWLVGPWLGTAPGVAEQLRSLLGRPCGETTSPPGGAAGARFESARDALLSAKGVRARRSHVQSIDTHSGRFRVRAPLERATANDAGFDAVVLAIGGIAAGGIVLGKEGFRASLEAEVLVGPSGRRVGQPSTVHGVDVAALGLAELERVGIVTEGQAVVGAAGLFAAGDCVAGRPRTALEAAAAGIAAAGRALAR